MTKRELSADEEKELISKIIGETTQKQQQSEEGFKEYKLIGNDYKSEDHEEFTVPREYIFATGDGNQFSFLVDLVMLKKDDNKIILDKISPEVLEKVVDYMKMHYNSRADKIDKPFKSSNLDDLISKYDREFLNTLVTTKDGKIVNINLLIGVTGASDFLGRGNLYDLCTSKLAMILKSLSTVDEIQKTFNISTDPDEGGWLKKHDSNGNLIYDEEEEYQKRDEVCNKEVVKQEIKVKGK